MQAVSLCRRFGRQIRGVGRGIVPGVPSGDPGNCRREHESLRIVCLFLFQNCENGMCTRNVKCALCSTFRGKSLRECKQANSCEENVQDVQIVDDIKKKTGKNGFSQTFFFTCRLLTITRRTGDQC